MLNGKQCRSRSVGFFRSQLIWIYTVCKGRVYPGSAGHGLNNKKLKPVWELWMKWALKRITVVNYGGKKRSCSVLLIFPLFLSFFFFSFIYDSEAMSPIRQYNTRSGSGLLCHISRHNKNIHNILRESLVMIIDIAFRISLFCVFFLPLLPSHSFTTIELQWLENLWDNGKVFKPWIVRANEG